MYICLIYIYTYILYIFIYSYKHTSTHADIEMYRRFVVNLASEAIPGIAFEHGLHGPQGFSSGFFDMPIWIPVRMEPGVICSAIPNWSVHAEKEASLAASILTTIIGPMFLIQL